MTGTQTTQTNDGGSPVAWNYSDNTILIYTNTVADFARYFQREVKPDMCWVQRGDPAVSTLPAEREKARLVNRSFQRTWSIEVFLPSRARSNWPWFAQEVAKPKIRRPLPTVLSRRVGSHEALLDANGEPEASGTAGNSLRATGLRCEEAPPCCSNWKVSDIDSQRMLVLVREGKGKTSQTGDALPSPKLLELLRIYVACWRKPERSGWFPGQKRRGRPMDPSGMRQICRV